MTAPTLHLEAAARHSIPVSEILDVLDSPAGQVIRTTDGASYVDVPADRPDGDGKTGLMFLAPPTTPYTGSFPLYTQPVADAEPAGKPAKSTAAAPSATKSRSDLVARAKELKIELRPRMSVDAIAEAIAEAEATVAAVSELIGDGEDGDDTAGDDTAGDDTGEGDVDGAGGENE